MNRLLAIVRKHHCVGTHQRFAVDALSMLRHDAGARLAVWILAHWRRYLEGAVAPDTRFRDYHNHLLHVRDGYWGGAPRVAHQWYARLLAALRDERFSDAAFAAGVLTHYVTDVVFPLHTISTHREALIHRPLEWSVESSYDEILRHVESLGLQVRLELSHRPGWLGSMMLHAARFAEQRSDDLLRRYRLPENRRLQAQALDQASTETLAELFALAIVATGRVLVRAADETESYTGYPLPECRLGFTTLAAAATIPVGLGRKAVRRHCESRAVEAIAEEYRATGRLNEHLPAEVDIKQRVIEIHKSEKRRQRARKAAA